MGYALKNLVVLYYSVLSTVLKVVEITDPKVRELQYQNAGDIKVQINEEHDQWRTTEDNGGWRPIGYSPEIRPRGSRMEGLVVGVYDHNNAKHLENMVNDSIRALSTSETDITD